MPYNQNELETRNTCEQDTILFDGNFYHKFHMQTAFPHCEYAHGFGG